jgi:hypothetical protein
MGAGIKDDILTALDLASLEQRLRGAPSSQSDLGGFADKLACRLQCHLCRASRADLGKGASVVTDRAGLIASPLRDLFAASRQSARGFSQIVAE